MTTNIGIDISGFQPDDVPGDWLFIVTKATEGLGYVNPKLGAQWAAAARTRRGMYHYARPGKSGGVAQADYFANTALAHGFKPGVDMWQLDCEGMLNDYIGGNPWASFSDEFMQQALHRLGKLGFIYVGQYFFSAAFQPLVQKYNWWLPNYGVNDGAVHPLPAGVNPVIHQFSSAGGLDRNVIHDQAKWNALTSSAPAPKPKPKVPPMYNPPFDIQSVSASLACPKGGAWVATSAGNFYGFGGAPYPGSLHDKPFFAGKEVAKMRLPNAADAHAGYVLVATSTDGHEYGVK